MKITPCLLLLLTWFQIFIIAELQMLDYSGKGWPLTCEGSEQSPVDFPEDFSKYIPLNNTRIVYSAYNILKDTKVQVLPDAKFAAKMDDMGYLIFEKNGLIYKYQLNEIHWHYRAEHTFGGREFDLEMHMVHTKDNEFFSLVNTGIESDPDIRNQKLVIGIIFDHQATSIGMIRHVTDDNSVNENSNPFFDKLKFSTLETIEPIDLNPFAGRNRLFLHYEGSLTTPTCNEIVNWVVMTEFESISRIQLDSFYLLISQNGYPNGNHRPTQPLNDRPIYYNDASTLNYVQEESWSSYHQGRNSLLILLVALVFFVI